MGAFNPFVGAARVCRSLCIGLLAVLALTSAHASQDRAVAIEPLKRVALVIGNASYTFASPLKNPGNDAADIAAEFKRLGFRVLEGRDLDKASMDRLVRDFAEALVGADVGVFFYAGHGLQVAGQNYLVPVDAKLKSSAGLDFETVRLDLVQQQMERETKTNVLFLDACRDNPLARNLARSLGTRSASVGRGLATIESGVGTLVSFATQPGNVALDGEERNSPFTAALLRHMSAPSRDLNGVLISVRNDVRQATAGRQVPWENSALTGQFFFNGSTIATASASDTISSPCAGADAHWRSAEAIGSKAALEDHANRFPNCAFAGLARAKIASLAQAETPAPIAVNPCALAGEHWRSAEAMGTRTAFESHLEQFPTCSFAALARERIAALKTASLPKPGPDSGGPIAITGKAFDGHWHSPEWHYSYILRNGVGTATTSNSPKFKPGDVIIKIQPTGPNTFAGEQVYRDGRWYKIKGALRSDGSIHINGEKNVSWGMKRIP